MNRNQQNIEVMQGNPDFSFFLSLKKEVEAKADQLRRNTLIDAETLSHRGYQLSLPELHLRAGELREEYRVVSCEIEVSLNPESQPHLGGHDAAEYGRSLHTLGLQLGDARKAIEAHPATGGERPTPLTTYERAVLKSPALILLLDVFFEAPALRLFVGSGLIAHGIALLINVCKYFLGKYLLERIRHSDTEIARKVWIALGIITYAGVALLLGFARHAYLELQDGGSPYGPIPLATLSFVISIAAWLAEYYAEGVRAKQSQIAEMSKTFDELGELEERKEAIEIAIEDMKKDKTQRLSTRLITMENAKSLHQYLEDHYRGTFLKFQSTYHSRRTDRHADTAPVFVTDIPPLHDAEYSDGSTHIPHYQP